MTRPLFARLALIALVATFPALRPATVFASGWDELDSLTNDTLLCVESYGDTVIAVGADGTVVYSDDNGETWEEGDSNTSEDLSAVSLGNADDAVAVGADGTIIFTTNGGEDWEDADIDYDDSSHSTYGLRAVDMVSSTVGFATGENGIVLYSDDGGENWDEIDGPSTSYDFNSVHAYSSSRLWVAGESGHIYYSDDGGDSWDSQSSGTTEHLVTITFYGTSDGWAVGENRKFIRTEDGGDTWSSSSISELEDDETINDISFRNSDDGLLLGQDGLMLETDDGGENWDTVSMSSEGVFVDIQFVSDSERWAVGDDGVIFGYDVSTSSDDDDDDDAPGKPTGLDVEGTNSDVTDSTPTFSWDAPDDNDIDYYEFKMDSGSYTELDDDTDYTYTTTLSNGSHTAYVRTVDESGNTSSSASLSFTVDADSDDDDAPTVGKISPTTAIKDTTITLSADVSDDGDIEDCDLYVDGAYLENMTLKTDYTYTTHKFTSSGSHTAYARCTDDDGNKTSGTSVTISVSSGTSDADSGDIIKIGCEGDVYVNDSCTSVYYYGSDGYRHAFPTEAIYKSWYSNYNNLVILSEEAMSEIPLGQNVTYRPGTSLVKFSTSTVYAVTYGGSLRPIANAEIAETIYGDDWVEEIDIVNDVFFGNYDIGEIIDSSNDYSKSAVKSASDSIDDVL